MRVYHVPLEVYDRVSHNGAWLAISITDRLHIVARVFLAVFAQEPTIFATFGWVSHTLGLEAFI
ncbi:uncharacterized protein G2W53_008071 [Senna tora]|uniref:Uncharacterized protein n=1 Tax=Senna tora TaxID=362788 RepID=A0A834X7M1_9FABA|nr:uncharacterized protein G2W53_008071 [Senna tora]